MDELELAAAVGRGLLPTGVPPPAVWRLAGSGAVGARPTNGALGTSGASRDGKRNAPPGELTRFFTACEG